VRGGTNLLRVRDFNQQVVLETIRGAGGVSRVEIARETGLTAQTISNIVKRLLAEGLVIEDGKGVPARGGKPRVRLKIKPEAGYALGVQIDRDEVFLMLLDLDGRPVRQTEHAIPDGQSPENVVDLVADLAEELIRDAGDVRDKTLGLGVASPGPLDPSEGVLYGPPGFAGWNEVPIKRMLEEKTGHTVLVDNDAIAAAIGERWAGKARGVDNFAYIYNGWGLGAGLFVDGHVFRGATGTAGEIGHIPLDPNGPECPCGNRGCLTRYCLPKEIISTVDKRLRAGEVSSLSGVRLDGGQISDLAVVHAAALSGDRVANEALSLPAKMLSKAVVGLVNLLDLQMVVLGGKTLGHAGRIYIKEVDESLRERILYRDRRQVRVELSGAGQHAGAIGAASLVLHAAYSPRMVGLQST
jgi:predicted NBD/HSP70 family sugar kinase